MFANLRNLSRQSIVYTIGEVLRSGVAFLLLPLYTRLLTPADYGILGVVAPVDALLTILMGLGLQSALMRFYFDHDANSEELRKYVGSISTFMLSTSLLIALLLTAIGPFVFARLLPQTPFRPYLLLTIWNACFAMTQVVPQVLFRARQQARSFVFLTFGTFLLTTILIIVFVAWLGKGALGSLQGQLIATTIVALPTLVIIVRNSTFRFSRTMVVASLAFSLPLLPHLLGGWMLNVSDRIVLENLVSKNDLGLYTLGYQFGMVLSVVTIALNNAWVPFFYQHAGATKDAPMIAIFITYQVLIIAMLALALALLSREVIQIIAAPAYLTAYRIVPWVVLGYFARFLYFFPVSSLFWVKRTAYVPVATIIAGTANVVLNLLLVPRFGIMAAAVSTFIGFLLLFGIIFFMGQRVFPIRYEYGRLARVFLLGVALFVIGSWMAPETLLGAILFKGTLIVAFPLLLAATGFFTVAERNRLAELWRRRFRPAG